MYQFAGDASADDTSGEGLGGVWFSVPVHDDSDSSEPTPSPTRDGLQLQCSAAARGELGACQVPSASGPSQDWTISESCSIRSGDYSFRKIIVTGGAVVAMHPGANINIDVSGGILVDSGSELWAGCESRPFLGSLQVQFSGARQDLTSSERWVKAGLGTWANALVVAANARLEIHGKPKRSWTSLSASGNPGDTTIQVADLWSDLAPGDQLAVVQSGSDRAELERRNVVAVNGRTIQLDRALQYFHQGGFVGAGARLNAEVGVLSHNIKFSGVFDADECQATFEWDGYGTEASKTACFGGILTFLQYSMARIEHAEFDRMGHGLTMGRYPLHWHHAGDQTGSYLKNLAVYGSSNRCVTIHGSFGALVEGLVCLENHGHQLYLEDGIEASNTFARNLVINPRNSHTICTDKFGAEGGPSGLWITNPNNTFTDNTVVGAAFGAWFTFPMPNHDPYSVVDQGISEVFGTSARHFAQEASGFGPDHWVMNQEQARTPVQAFDCNSFKGNLRMGIAVDFRVYDSKDAYIPCSVKNAYTESECPTCANVGHSFTWAPMTGFDPSTPMALRKYTPIKQDFNDIVITHTTNVGHEQFTVWATGGNINLVRPKFYSNQVGASLGHHGHCAGGLLGAGGTNLRLEHAVFIDGAPPFKLYDGGYYCYNCRWAQTSFLVTMRPGSPGNVNGLILERSAPLGWCEQDRQEFSWLWESEWDAASKTSPRTATVSNLIDFSSPAIQTSWEADYMMVVTTDGLYGTASDLGGRFTQWIRQGDPSVTDWGLGVIKNASPNFRQFQPCRQNRPECLDGRYPCSAHFDGKDILNAPW